MGRLHGARSADWCPVRVRGWSLLRRAFLTAVRRPGGCRPGLPDFSIPLPRHLRQPHGPRIQLLWILQGGGQAVVPHRVPNETLCERTAVMAMSQ
jgi:hypothetical protein